METVLIMSSVFLWLVVIANLLLTLALIRRLNSMVRPAETGLKTGEAAPNFIAQTLQNTTKTLADYAGQAVAFIFISTTCRPCRERVPMLQKSGSAARANGVEFVLVSGDGLEETQAWSEDMDLQLPIVVAPRSDNTFFQDYKVVSTPAFCLIGPEGNVHRASILGLEFEDWRLLTRTQTFKGR